jgi:hypothetical protein
VKILLEALDVRTGWVKNRDYIMWIDADFVFTDFDFKIESIVDMHPTAHMLASAGINSVIADSALIVRNTKWTRQFLHDWWNTDRSKETVRARFDSLYLQEKFNSMNGFGSNKFSSFENKISILPADLLNSLPPVWATHPINSAVLHLHGEIGVCVSLLLSRFISHRCVRHLQSGRVFIGEELHLFRTAAKE